MIVIVVMMFIIFCSIFFPFCAAANIIGVVIGAILGIPNPILIFELIVILTVSLFYFMILGIYFLIKIRRKRKELRFKFLKKIGLKK